MKVCLECSAEFKSLSAYAKWCPTCRLERRRSKKLEHYHSKDANRRRERTAEEKVRNDGDIAFTTPDPWKNLMLAIIQNARDENDQEYLNEFGQLYRDAILGGIGWQKNEEGTYIKR